MSQSHDTVAYRLASILQKLNQGEKLDPNQLAEEYQVHRRTIMRDLTERFTFLPLNVNQGIYSLEPSFLGKFDLEDINRFAKFASIRDLFGKIDQQFFQKYLTDSVLIKGITYEKIGDKQPEFELISQAILQQQHLQFFYQRVQKKQGDTSVAFEVEPYKLINNNGVWYLIALHDKKVKVFSFTRISLPKVQTTTFAIDLAIKQRIETGDGIYFEGVMDEVILKIHSSVAVYFTRRALLPNQEIIQELTNGTLIVLCRNVHEQQILPLVRYWLPNLTIVAPDNLRQKLMNELEQYFQQHISA